MRIGFGDFSGWDFHTMSVETIPLGGSQSAACYLARSLAQMGHDIFFLTHTTSPAVHGGVTCLSWYTTPPDALRLLHLDVFVCVLGTGNGSLLRSVLEPKTRLLLWTQHRCDQQAVQLLDEASERKSYDDFVFVSEWQRAEFLTRFALPPEKTHVLRNAVAPAFLSMDPEGTPILPQKARPPVLAYTSTPFRGLDLLLTAFPAIRMQITGVKLRVFSSMRVYQAAPHTDHAHYGALYERCRQTPGVEYIGSIPQPALAHEMRCVTALAYPNTFAETSCIAALEAMASGCRIITSFLGALPETTAGFADLIPSELSQEEYLHRFTERTVALLREASNAPSATEDLLRRQVSYIRNSATWERRAMEWDDWLRMTGSAPASN